MMYFLPVFYVKLNLKFMKENQSIFKLRGSDAPLLSHHSFEHTFDIGQRRLDRILKTIHRNAN